MSENKPLVPEGQQADPDSSLDYEKSFPARAAANSENPARDADGLIDFRHLFLLLLNRWWIIAIIVGVCTLSAAGTVMRQPKIFESRAVLQVQQQEQNVIKIDGVMQENPSSLDFINTVVQALSSRNLMLRVIEANRLRDDPTFVAKGTSPTDIQLADKLRKKVSVSLRTGTRLIDIVVSDRDPVTARDIAASMVREFLRENFAQRLRVSQVASDFLQEEAEKLKRKLEESELKLQSYKENNQAVSLEDRQNITVDRLRELSSMVTEANSQRLKLESDIEQVRRANPQNTEDLLRIGSVAQIPQVADARAQLLQATTEFSGLQDRYGHKHPKLIAAAARIEALKRTLAESTAKAGDILNRQYEAAVQTEFKLTAALKEQETAALELNKIAIPFNVLQREVESDRALYDSVINRLKETSVTGAVEQAPYTLIEEAMVPATPSKPHVTRTILIAFFLSLFAAVALVIVLDGFDSSLRSIDQAESALGLPALVGIPNHRRLAPRGGNQEPSTTGHSSRDSFQRYVSAYTSSEERADEDDIGHSAILARADRQNYPIAAIEAPSSSLAEAYRTLRVSISMLGPEQERRILLFVSAVPEEGKTYTSLNTAVVLAQQGSKTLLLDADLRRPSLHKALQSNTDLPIGLTDFFSGNAKLSDVIQQTDIENLFLLPAGRRAPNPAELLASSDLPRLFDQLLKKFDRIVIDSAPVNAVSDTLVIAPHAQKTILVVRAGKTPQRAVNRGVMLLRKSGARIAGFVLNRLPSGRSAGYYYYYYGDKYEKDSAYGSAS
jgi:capsular exopolysaccharide synthesis family protein